MLQMTSWRAMRALRVLRALRVESAADCARRQLSKIQTAEIAEIRRESSAAPRISAISAVDISCLRHEHLAAGAPHASLPAWVQAFPRLKRGVAYGVLGAGPFRTWSTTSRTA